MITPPATGPNAPSRMTCAVDRESRATAGSSASGMNTGTSSKVPMAPIKTPLTEH